MGIFGSQSKLWTRYRAELQFRDKIVGGVPRKADVIEGWIRSKAGVTDEEEIGALIRRTMLENGTLRPDMTQEEVEAASKQVAAAQETTGFKRDTEGGLYIESRQIKAALKESTNVLFAGEKWGATRKGPRSFLAERVFVSPDIITLGVTVPTDVLLMIGHIIGPQGPRSTLGYHEYVERSHIAFDVLVARDSIPHEAWPDLWEHAQENGIGALRSQGYGRFDITRWDVVPLTTNAPRRR